MSDEEDDYMSDKFLTGLQDVRPSLISNRAKKRQIHVETKRKDNIKKQKEVNKHKLGLIDNDSLQASLSTPISRENKGFKLLAKMGYKPGQSLGKTVISEKNSCAINNEVRLMEPIGIKIKADRQGLGREAALQELQERRLQIRKQRLKKKLGAETTIEDFRRRTNQKHEDKFVQNALKRCQLTCENLDNEYNVEKPDLAWFWPEKTTETSEDVLGDEDELTDEAEEFSPQEKLEILTNYMRTSYMFCYWCGVQYNDPVDLSDNCPGLTKDDH